MIGVNFKGDEPFSTKPMTSHVMKSLIQWNREQEQQLFSCKEVQEVYYIQERDCTVELSIYYVLISCFEYKNRSNLFLQAVDRQKTY